ncbi:PIG-L deacetylase family protein [Oceanicola sp. 502str15]|uniref:PIG-L deacetylase family protein n=1 Tax=Oceanicola sp. 502str15 TaxID=2696061 RepID=UPI0020951C43|nr:PIG-L family deacetylase [Oceanicola sp. 502str15]MCO6383343.1 PIG-L family deacetylase [Oceanicola sp. 502str15]
MSPAFTPVVAAAAAAPPIALGELTGTGDVLMLAPHPDDETLAAGAALAATWRSGRRAHVAVVTDGSRSHPNSARYPAASLAALRRREVTRAVRLLSGNSARPIWLGYPDLAAPEDPAAFAAVAARLGQILPDVSAIWSTWWGDPHPDHQRTWALACYLAARRPGCRLYACPVWGRVQGPAAAARFSGLRRFRSAPLRALKARALAAHASQMTPLIDDDPTGFTMATDLAEHFVDTDEIFIPA